MVKALEAGKLIVGAIAVSLDPSGTAAAAFGIDGALQAKAWFQDTPDLTKLSNEIDKKFHADLTAPRFDKPSEARILLPQMLEAAFPSGTALADAGLDPDQIYRLMCDTLDATDSEYQSYDIRTAFAALVKPLLEEACADPRLEAAIRPLLTRKQMADSAETKSDVKDLKAMMEALMSDEHISLNDMRKLASAFGEHEISDQAALERFLRLKANEYRAFKAELLAIETANEDLKNIVADALRALEDLRIHDAEELIFMAREKLNNQLRIPLLRNAELSELQAKAALLRNDVQAAFSVLDTAATSLSIVDENKSLELRGIRFFGILFQHFKTFGGQAIEYAIRLSDQAFFKEHDDRYAGILIASIANRTIALRNLASLKSGEEQKELLQQCANDYYQQVSLIEAVGSEKDLAKALNSLSICLMEQAKAEVGNEGLVYLRRALRKLKQADKLLADDDKGETKIGILGNLGACQHELALSNSTGDAVGYLLDAVNSRESAAKLVEEEQNPSLFVSVVANLVVSRVLMGTCWPLRAAIGIIQHACYDSEYAIGFFDAFDNPNIKAHMLSSYMGALYELAVRQDEPDKSKTIVKAQEIRELCFEQLGFYENPILLAQTHENSAWLSFEAAKYGDETARKTELRRAISQIARAHAMLEQINHPKSQKSKELEKRILADLDALPDG